MDRRMPARLRPSANLSHSRYDFAKTRIQRLLPSMPAALVFDIGAGDGRMRSLEEYGVRWRGFDRETWGVEEQWNLDLPPPVPECAGAVLLLDVIEHCSNPLLSLKNIALALHPGGYLILTAPNPHWSRSRSLISSEATFGVLSIKTCGIITMYSLHGPISLKRCSSRRASR